MKVLVVCRYHNGIPAPFVVEQVDAVSRAAKNRGVAFEFRLMDSAGGYARFTKRLHEIVNEWHPDVVHAHYGVTGFFCCLRKEVPTVVTYHGSDVNNGKTRWLCVLTRMLSDWNIYVSDTLYRKAGGKRGCDVVACGVDVNVMRYNPDRASKEREFPRVLFAGAFDVTVKNAALARKVVFELANRGVRIDLRELKGMSRDEVAVALNKSDAMLMTSRREGSPQVIKEAIACGVPIVSVAVGDVRERLKNISNAIVVERATEGVDDDGLVVRLADALQRAVRMEHLRDGVEELRRQGLTNDVIAERVLDIYQKIKKQ